LKKILFLCLFVALAGILVGQELYQDVIYLKNGEAVRGVLVNEVLSTSAQIVNQNGDTLTFRMVDILKLTRENIQKNSVLPVNDQWLKPGYELIIEAGKAIALGEFGINYFQADVINGVRLNSYFSSGFGIGLSYINDPNYMYYVRPKIIIPVYLDIRINYPTGKIISPYLAFDIGGSLDKDEDWNGNSSIDFVGIFLKSSLGMHLRFYKSISLNLAVGYRSQKMPFNHILYPGRNADGAHTDFNFSNSINIIGGLTF
jgi:hypothetical protein